MKEEHEDAESPEQAGGVVVASGNSALAEQLAQELQCGCCNDLVYRPVLVAPCQHFFCGRYAAKSIHSLQLADLNGTQAAAYFGFG